MVEGRLDEGRLEGMELGQMVEGRRDEGRLEGMEVEGRGDLDGAIVDGASVDGEIDGASVDGELDEG